MSVSGTDGVAELGSSSPTAASVAASPAGLTVPATPDLSGTVSGSPKAYKVGGWYEGGAAGTDYRVTCTATLAGGGTAVGVGTLRVV